MKPLDVTQLGMLYRANPLAHYLYLATKTAHESRDPRRDKIRALLTDEERELLEDISGIDPADGTSARFDMTERIQLTVQKGAQL